MRLGLALVGLYAFFTAFFVLLSSFTSSELGVVLLLPALPWLWLSNISGVRVPYGILIPTLLNMLILYFVGWRIERRRQRAGASPLAT